MAGGFLPWLGVMPQLDEAIDQGLGVVGAVVGQPFDVYRLSDTTNVGVLENDPIYTSFPINLRRYTLKVAIENTTFELLTYVANCDRRQLQLMDLLVTEGYGGDSAVFCVAQMRPMAETILVRVESNVSLSAIVPTAGAASQQPSSGNTFISGMDGWSAVWKSGEQILTLTDGEYAWSDPTTDPPPTPAQIQVGLQPNARIRDGNTLGVPTEQYREQFVIYTPITPGVFLEEVKTRFNFGNASSDRYEIAKYFTSDETGLAGQIAICEKLPF